MLRFWIVITNRNIPQSYGTFILTDKVRIERVWTPAPKAIEWSFFGRFWIFTYRDSSFCALLFIFVFFSVAGKIGAVDGRNQIAYETWSELIFCVRNLKGFLETAIGYKLTCCLHWSVWKYQCISTFFISNYYNYTPFLGLCYGFMNYILLRCQDADNITSLKSLAFIPSQVKYM